jgi:hypothetical protein
MGAMGPGGSRPAVAQTEIVGSILGDILIAVESSLKLPRFDRVAGSEGRRLSNGVVPDGGQVVDDEPDGGCILGWRGEGLKLVEGLGEGRPTLVEDLQLLGLVVARLGKRIDDLGDALAGGFRLREVVGSCAGCGSATSCGGSCDACRSGACRG